MPELWDLMVMLPNLDVPIPTPFDSDGYVISSGTDPRLSHLADSAANVTSVEMLNRFWTQRGVSYKPACLLIRSDIPKALRTDEAIRAFRNICAISATTSAFATGLEIPSAAQWRVKFGDQFKFGYLVAGANGWVQTLDGAARGIDDAIPTQRPDPQFGDPTNWTMSVDRPLFGRLCRCWRRCYFQRRDRMRMLRLFRALEVAFHASLYPGDGLPSINDIGTRLALWVSALEVLCHPGSKVDKREVQATLRSAPFTEPTLTTTRFTIQYQRRAIPATLPEALYDDLYWTRNQFLHGMAVRWSTLHYRQSKRFQPLTVIAPVLFNAALIAYLGRCSIAGGPVPERRRGTIESFLRDMATREGFEQVERGLIAAGRPRP